MCNSNTKKLFSFFTFNFSLLIFLAGCASGPSSYFRLKPVSKDTHVKTAIIPFTNLTSEKDAEKKIAYALITHLLNTTYFDIVETGEVQKAMRDGKVRKDEDLSLENIKSIGQLTGADVLLMGVVEEYKIDSSTLLGEKVFVPEASVSLRLVSVKDGSIVWSVNHHRRGDDRVTIFGMGRVDSISTLTDIIIKNSVDSLMRVMRKRRNALAMLKNNPPAEEAVGKDAVIKKTDKQGRKDAGRQKAIEDAIKGSGSKKEIKKEKAVSLPPVKDVTKPKDARQEIKDQYNQEYEKIKKQY
ncbi:MAG: CsgG/HfaB family protein [Candidatus Omnitrophota bacterium]|nr:CsgG/HfaB family protein [Candidatus Omnitrophota bacterium]